MSIQKLHYENISGTLVRREGLLSWRCPLCKAEGQTPGVMHTCPECGSKEATLPGAKPMPSVPDGWKEAAIAWEVCASIHREYGKGKDPFFNTRQGDFVKHANDARAMLAKATEAKP